MYDNLYVDIVNIEAEATNSSFDAMDLGTWDEMEIACDASLAASDEKKDVGILAIA